MAVQTVDSLTNLDTGRWLVATETSSYMLDLDARTARRIPGYGVGSLDGLPLHTALLRRDDTDIELEQIIELTVGKPMMLLLDLRQDGVMTLRRSTIVAAISAVTDNTAD